MATLSSAYRARIAKKYSNPWGNRFARVEIVDKATGRVAAFEDVLVRSGFKGSEETRASVIKDTAVETIHRVSTT